jgi:kynurenine formamidase
MNYIDLTLELYDGLTTYKSHPPISIKPSATFETTGHRYEPPCLGFRSSMIAFSDHSGTHVDAPSHFLQDGASAEALDVRKLLGSALVLDVTPWKKPDEPVTAEMLKEAEKKQGLYVEEGDIVLIRTWTGQWGDEGFFEAKALDASAGKWLAERNIYVVGLDLPNIDVHDNMKREVHLELLAKDILIVENLVNLDKVPTHSRFIFMGMPLKLRGATASPIRALAILDAQFID